MEEELKPIRAIKANFGSPQDFSPPSSYAFCEKLAKEAQDAEEDDSDLVLAEYSIWESSLTPEERKTHTHLQNQVDTTIAAYNSRIHGNDSPEAKAYFAADNALCKFRATTGQHLCFSCAYYFYDPVFNRIGVCERLCEQNHEKDPIYVRPSCLACKHYTDVISAKMKLSRDIYRQQSAKISCPNRKELIRLDNARHFCKLIKDTPSTAFYLYKTNPSYYEKLYGEFPFLFAVTNYPSFPLFLEAYTRWEKDAIITHKEGKDGAEEVSISISNPEFVGKDIPVPPTTPAPSDN